MRYMIVTIKDNKLVGVYSTYLEARKALNTMFKHDIKARCDHTIKGVLK